MEIAAKKNSTFFERLPNDVAISIMKKLPNDLKFLTQCYLVSKQFASVIRYVPDVRLTLPPPPLTKRWRHRCINFKEFRSQVMSSYARTTNLLPKFQDLRSLHLVVPDDLHLVVDDDEKPRRYFWHMKVKAEAEVCTVAYLHSCSMHNMDDGDPKFATANGRFCDSVWMDETLLWQDLVVKIIQDYPMLQSVKISSADLSNKLVLQGEDLIKLKKLKMSIGSRESEMKMMFCEALTLPASRYVMKNVVVLIKRIGGENHIPKTMDDIIAWDYEEDEKVFGEAMKALKSVLMKN